MELVSLKQIQEAARRNSGVVVHTPLLRYFPAADTEIWLKPESLQPVGSFKIRGSYNKITKLVEQGFSGTIIAFSSGNHAQGVAYSAKKHCLKAIIVMPNNCPPVKIKKTKALGAEVVLYDPLKDSREDIAKRLVAEHNGVLVPPYDDPDIIAGNGTLGLEIYEDLPDVDLVLTCIGGGGHIAGVATALKTKNPNIKIIGVEPEKADDARRSLETGQIEENDDTKAQQTIADGIRTHQLGSLSFEHIKKYVDKVIAVSEEEIWQAARMLYFDSKLVVEPTGAVAFAAVLSHRQELPPAKRIVVIISGGSADPSFVAELAKSA